MTAISRQFAVGFAAVCFVCAIGRTPMARLRERISVPALAVVVYALVCLLSGLWSHFGAYAARESVKILIALAIFGLVLVRTRRERLRGLLWSLNGVLAVVSLLCIDASSWQMLTRGFSAVMKLFHSSYPLETIGYETGVRITGIFSNANVSAGMIAFGLVVSLYLYQTAESVRGRALTALALGVEALAFFLSFSMGAMGAFAVTCLVYLLCAGRGHRVRLFFLMAECVAVTVLCAFGAYPFLGTGNPAPLLLALVCGPAIWALDEFVLRRVLAALETRGKAVGIAVGALVALAAVYVVLAMNVTGPATLTEGETLSRAVYPGAGAYTVTAQGADAHAVIYSQNESELMMHTHTPLYEGALDGASFTVPADSKVVWFDLTGSGRLTAAALSDGTELPLGYRLLPGFAANRLQGLRANQNFIQRLVFFRDGLALWRESPVIGWGVGGVEGQLTSVQSFYYESKYIHNQFIQILDEAGVVGLCALLALLGSAVGLLFRRRKEEREPIFAMLAACLTMMIAHSLTEVVWSAQMYQVVVFTLLAVLIIQYHQPATGRNAVALGRLTALALWGTVLVFSGLQASSLLAANRFRGMENSGMSQSEFVAALQRLDAMEVYDDTAYQTNRMANSLQMGNTTGRGIAAKCADQLMAKKEFEACYNVAAYYYLPLERADGFFEAVRTGILQEGSNPDAWDSGFHLCAQALLQVEMEALPDFVSGVAELGEFLTAFNVGRMQPIVLDEGNQALLACATALHSGGADGETAQAALQALLG